MAINDLWNKGKEVVVEGAKNLAKAGAEAARSTWGSAQRTMGLGAEATPGATPEAETPRSTGNFEQRRADAAAKAQAEMQRNTLRGQQVQPWNTVTGQQFTPGNAAPSSGGAIVTRDPMLGPQQPAIDGVARNATNDGFGPSKGIDPNARGTVPGVTPAERVNGSLRGSGPEGPKPGLLSRATSGLFRGLGAAQAGVGVYDAAQGRYGDAVDNIAQGAATAVNPMVGAAGNLLTAGRDMALRYAVNKMVPERSSTFTPQTWAAVDAPKPEKNSMPPAPAAPRDVQPTPATPTWNADDIDTSKVPPMGAGSFRVGKNPAQAVFTQPTERDLRAAQIKGQGKSVYGMGNGLDESPGLRRPGSVVTSGTQGGVGGELGNMVGMVAKGMAEKNRYNAGVTQRNQDLKAAEVGLRTATLNATLAQQKRAAEKDEGERINRRIEIEAANNIEPRKAGVAGIGGEKADEYNSRLDKAKKQLQGDIEFTVSNRKGGDAKNVEQLSRAEQSELFLLAQIKQKSTDARSGTFQQLRDLFGNKRADSRDLDSYKPAKVETAANGGYLITLQNGNKVEAGKLENGEWNMFGPNGAVDKDIASLYGKLIEEYNKKGKK